MKILCKHLKTNMFEKNKTTQIIFLFMLIIGLVAVSTTINGINAVENITINSSDVFDNVEEIMNINESSDNLISENDSDENNISIYSPNYHLSIVIVGFGCCGHDCSLATISPDYVLFNDYYEYNYDLTYFLEYSNGSDYYVDYNVEYYWNYEDSSDHDYWYDDYGTGYDADYENDHDYWFDDWDNDYEEDYDFDDWDDDYWFDYYWFDDDFDDWDDDYWFDYYWFDDDFDDWFDDGELSDNLDEDWGDWDDEGGDESNSI